VLEYTCLRLDAMEWLFYCQSAWIHQPAPGCHV